MYSPVQIHFVPARRGAEEHCQCGAASLSHQRIFDWLDETFAHNLNKKYSTKQKDVSCLDYDKGSLFLLALMRIFERCCILLTLSA
jgi:hypothetical protein